MIRLQLVLIFYRRPCIWKIERFVYSCGKDPATNNLMQISTDGCAESLSLSLSLLCLLFSTVDICFYCYTLLLLPFWISLISNAWFSYKLMLSLFSMWISVHLISHVFLVSLYFIRGTQETELTLDDFTEPTPYTLDFLNKYLFRLIIKLY